MIAIASYFAFIIIVMDTLLSAQEIFDEEREKFIQEILEAHNNHRKTHGSNPLVLDEEMCKEAKISVEEWIENSGTLEIPDQYGVNHLMLNLRKDDLDAKLITENWYQYHYNYNYNEEPSTHLPTNPFTRIVWRSTERLGVGISQKDNLVRVLVFYFPPGNQIGQYVKNVINPVEVPWLNLQLTDSEEQVYFESVLKAHNFFRGFHDSPNVVLDEELCVLAKKRVREWRDVGHNEFATQYGMNDYVERFSSKSKLNPIKMVTNWYLSKKKYDYTVEPSQPSLTNPFTRLIWKSTEKIGVGILIRDDEVAYIVVLYSPASNIPGQYLSNINRLRGNSEEEEE